MAVCYTLERGQILHMLITGSSSAERSFLIEYVGFIILLCVWMNM